MEILSPAGSLASVKAGVMSGANAIYMGYGDFNARRNAKNFTEEEFLEALDLCEIYNVKAYITMNIILTDRELKNAVEFIKFIASTNISAIIVQDIAVLELIQKIAPSIPVHASTQMTVHNLQGVQNAQKLGFKRVVLSRELSFENIEYICANSPIEIEVFVHGALCMSYSGQCYMSSIIGSRSGNRGLCAQPCRLPYSYDDEKTKAPLLSLKDLSLVNHVEKLKKAKVSCLKIEGRMKRPEYTAIVTKTYSTILNENRLPTDEEMQILESIFSRTGFTDAYFTGDINQNMFGVKSAPKDLTDLHQKITDEYEKNQKLHKISMNFTAKSNENINLTVTDISTNISVTSTENPPEIAINKPSTVEQITASLSKTGGTIFTPDEIIVQIDDGLMVRASTINKLRRECLENLTNLKFQDKNYEILDYNFDTKVKNMKKNPKFSVEITKLSQICDTMYKEKPEILYIPIVEIFENQEQIEKLMKNGFNICAKLPRIITDNQNCEFEKMIEILKKLNITQMLITNICQIREDFDIFGDFSMNIFNSIALKRLKDLGFKRQTLSFELKSSQIRDISKSIPTEILAYGHLPLMVFENCLIKNKKSNCSCKTEQTFLTDRKGEKFALLPEFGSRNSLLNSKPLYILDKMKEFSNIGVDVFKIYFSIESHEECEKIYKAHINHEELDLDFTRGLYYRGAL